MHWIDAGGVELPYGRLPVDDVRHRTGSAMTQAPRFLAMEPALAAQAMAGRVA